MCVCVCVSSAIFQFCKFSARLQMYCRCWVVLTSDHKVGFLCHMDKLIYQIIVLETPTFL